MSDKMKKTWIVIGIVAAVLFLLLATAWSVYLSYYSKLNFQTAEEEALLEPVGEETAVSESGEPSVSPAEEAEPPESPEPDAVQPGEKAEGEAAAEEPPALPEEETETQVPAEEPPVPIEEEEGPLIWSEDTDDAAAFVAGEDWDYSGKKVKNILLIGVDNDNLGGLNKRGNADGLVILSINESTKQLVLSSLMRDIDVTLPKGEHTKITLSYHLGGVAGLIEVIERSFNIPIDNYVLVNYLNLIEIIDAFGGVTLEVSAVELDVMEDKIKNLNWMTGQPANSNMIPFSQAGLLTLNGVQTTAYLRIRDAGHDDFDRTGRARTVLIELKKKAQEMSIGELNDMMDVVLPNIQTDLTQMDILSLMLKSGKYLKYQVVSNRIPIDGSYRMVTRVGSEVDIDFQVNNAFLYYTIYEGHEPDPVE